MVRRRLKPVYCFCLWPLRPNPPRRCTAGAWSCAGLADASATEPADPQWELHNLTVDPEERANRAADADAASVLAQLRTVLDDTRESMRRTPEHVNPRT